MPIRVAVLRQWLTQYPDKAAAALLLKGFSQGFSLEYLGAREPRDSECLPSATRQPMVVREKLRKEIDMGRMAGPFTVRPLPRLQCSPIGLVPKSEPNSFHLIHHLSFPAGESVNDFIDKAI